MLARAIQVPCCSLGLQTAEEALHRRVVPDLAGATHAAGDALFLEQLLEVIAGVLGGFNRSSQHLDHEGVLWDDLQGGC